MSKQMIYEVETRVYFKDEIEMTAENLEDASSKELEIMNFIEYYQLEDRVLREEPPMLFNGMLN